MKQNLRKLNLISRFIPIDMFYSVSVRASEIVLQGYYKHDIARIFISLKFAQDMKPNGYIEFTRSNITIILT